MSTGLSYEQLSEELLTAAFDGVSPSAVFGVARRPEPFVGPTFEVVEEGAPGAVIHLVAARGATGKSTLAEALSAHLRVPLWKLEDDRGVSGDALASRLREYDGTSAGTAMVVVDALDEARLRVSGVSWQEFAASIHDAAQHGHRFLLLGRERVVEDLWVIFDDLGSQPRYLELSHFGEPQRTAYIDGHLVGDRDPEDRMYCAARDSVLGALTSSVDGDLAEAFAGYAPVLDAVVALLRTGNLYAVKEQFDASNSGQWLDVLVSVVERLLKREQKKTQRLALDLGLPPEAAYAPREQMEWLANQMSGAPRPRLEWCPDDKRAEYLARLDPFLAEHPFRSGRRWSSPVFSAFTAATLFETGEMTRDLVQIGATTGLLYQFVTRPTGDLLVDETQFAALHHSLLAAESRSVQASVQVEATSVELQPADLAAGELVLSGTAGAASRTRVDISLASAGRLSLPGPMASVSVSFPGTVVIGRADSPLTLGPDCFISCDHLSVLASSMQLSRRPLGSSQPPQQEEGIVLEIREGFETEATLTGTPSADELELRVDPKLILVYPWVNYRRDLAPDAVEPGEKAVRLLRMLMELARRHGHKGKAAVYDKKLEGRQSLKDDDFRRALDVLRSHGVITMRGPMIELSYEWEERRFSGRDRPGQASLADRMDVWGPVLADMSKEL